MHKSIVYISCILCLFGCFGSSEKETDKKIENVTVSHIDTLETKALQIDPSEVDFYPDTCIGMISLYQSNKIEKYLGKDPMSRILDDYFPSLNVLSSDKTQKLTVIFHPGSVVNEFSEFSISYNTDNEVETYITSDNEFITESGIKLGISIDELKGIKGIPASTIEDETVLISYKIVGIENSEFLRRYNMPEYYARYKFENGKLIEFQFGFEYP